MKNYLKILSLITLFIFSSCEKDLYEDGIRKSYQKKISFGEFKKETKVNDLETIFQVPISQSSEISRSAELSDFIVDTLAVNKYVSESNNTTYSFRIYTLATNADVDEKYNLVYTKVDDTWEKTIIAFKERLNASSTENQYEEFVKLYDSRIANTTMAAVSEVCFSETYLFHCTNTGQCRDTGVCDGCYLCVTRVVSVNFCEGSSGGITDPGGNGSTNPGDAGYIPIDPFEFSINLYDNPVYDNAEYINIYKANHFFSHLSDGQKSWVGQHLASYQQVVAYMITNNWSLNSVTFANSLINVCAQNNSSITLNSSLNTTNSLAFNDINEYDAFMQQYNDVELDEIILANQNNDYIANYKFSIGYLGGIKMNVKFQSQNNNSFAVSNVTSNTYGVLLGSWEQSDYVVNVLQNGFVKIDLYGTLTVGIDIEGLPTSTAINYHFKLIVDSVSSGVQSSSWSHD